MNPVSSLNSIYEIANRFELHHTFKSWLADREQVEMPGLYQKKGCASKEKSWYKVMCLTGVPEPAR